MFSPLPNTDLGWKVAWSDRMVSLYGGVLFAALIFWLIRRANMLRAPRWYWAFGTMPMVVDGATHWISNFSGGLEKGFRYTNTWLATLTHNVFPTWFYIGDAAESFNSWVRVSTGVLFGFVVAWFAFYILEQNFRDIEDMLVEKRNQSDYDTISDIFP